MALPMEDESRIGEMVAQKYRLEQLLGVGGVGLVYRAQNVLLGRSVAIKLLKPEFTKNKDLISRFLREARAANLVRHANVVDVLDVGMDEVGTPYIVQELLQGEDLSQYLARLDAPLPIDSAISLMLPVIDAVAFAHVMGVVHRDLKPDNVYLVQAEGGVIPKVLDFGISKMAETSENLKITSTGIAMGTPSYMSPEQIQRFGEIDARADVWALGVMIYELVSGTLPFNAESSGALFVEICTKDPVPLERVAPEAPADLVRIVMRCMRRDPDERYPTAAELARDLRNMREGRPIDPTKKIALLSMTPPPVPIAGRQTGRTSNLPVGPEISQRIVARSRTGSSPAVYDRDVPTDPEVGGAAGAAGANGTGAPSRSRGLLIAAGVVALMGVAAVGFGLTRASTSQGAAVEAPHSTAQIASPPQRAHTLLIQSVPSGATVSEDGHSLGTTPLAVALDSTREREFIVSLAGRVPYTIHQGPSQEDVRVVAALAPAAGNTPSPAAVGATPSSVSQAANRPVRNGRRGIAAHARTNPTAQHTSVPEPTVRPPPSLEIRTER